MAASVSTGFPVVDNEVSETVVRVSATSPATTMVSVAAPYRIFAPKTQTQHSVIDYEVWDLALHNIVLRLAKDKPIELD